MCIVFCVNEFSLCEVVTVIFCKTCTRIIFGLVKSRHVVNAAFVTLRCSVMVTLQYSAFVAFMSSAFVEVEYYVVHLSRELASWLSSCSFVKPARSSAAQPSNQPG